MMMKNQNKEPEYLNSNEIFETADLGLACSLTTVGYPIWSMDKSNTSKVKFCFKRDERLDEVIRGYWDGKLTVSARALFENNKNLKNRIYSS